jgi:hypothetical protein
MTAYEQFEAGADTLKRADDPLGNRSDTRLLDFKRHTSERPRFGTINNLPPDAVSRRTDRSAHRHPDPLGGRPSPAQAPLASL